MLEKIRTAINIPRTIGIDDELLFSTFIDGDDDDKRGEQWASIEKTFGGGPMLNIGGGGNREQRWQP